VSELGHHFEGSLNFVLEGLGTKADVTGSAAGWAALGQKRTFAGFGAMSAKCQKRTRTVLVELGA